MSTAISKLQIKLFHGLEIAYQKSRIVCPDAVVVHMDFCIHLVSDQSSTFARPVVPPLHRQSFLIAQYPFPIDLVVISNCSFLFRLLWQFSCFPIAQCLFSFSLVVVSVQLLSNFFDCFGSCFRLLGSFFIALAVVSDC